MRCLGVAGKEQTAPRLRPLSLPINPSLLAILAAFSLFPQRKCNATSSSNTSIAASSESWHTELGIDYYQSIVMPKI
jgi:hypothetical protein